MPTPKLKNLLGNGYFPPELPTSFSSSEFAEKATKLAKHFPENFISHSESISIRKVGNIRRQFKLPNPVNQYLLTNCLINHWTDLSKHYKKSSLSNLLIDFNFTGSGRPYMPDFKRFSENKTLITSSHKTVLKTDYARF
jgi:hypothetical protein